MPLKYSFSIYGHQNILGEHKNTLEFTKDSHVTKNGDCIIGVSSDFSLPEIKKFTSERICITIKGNGAEERITGILNGDFSSSHEIVIRKSEYNSSRTLMFRADKASIDLNRNLVLQLQQPNNKLTVVIEEISTEGPSLNQS